MSPAFPINNTGNVTYSYPPPPPLVYWLIEMIAMSLFNVTVYLVLFCFTKRYVNHPHMEHHQWSYYYLMTVRYLPLPYVVECTWRSFLPTLYNSRHVVYDTPASSILLERSLAFVGEVSWGCQLGITTAVISHAVPMRGSPRVQKFLRGWIPLMGALIGLLGLCANIFSMIATVTTNYYYNVWEESLWAAAYGLCGVSGIALWLFGTDDFCIHWLFEVHPYSGQRHDHHHDDISIWVMRIYIRLLAIVGSLGVPYMAIYDIPRWNSRYQIDQAAGKVYFSLSDPSDAANRRVVVQDNNVWAPDQVWMLMYFGPAVLTCVVLMLGPGRVRIESCNCSHPSAKPRSGGAVAPANPAISVDPVAYSQA